MPDRRVPGHSFVTRRAIVDIVRPAVSGSYGVLGFAEPNIWKRVLRSLGGPESGIRVSLRDGIAIDLHLSVAYGLPVAEVARQADSAVRYAIRRSLGREVARLTVHVGGLRFQPAQPTPATFEEAQRAQERHVGDDATTSTAGTANTGASAPGVHDGSPTPADRPTRTTGSAAGGALSPTEHGPSPNGRAGHGGNGTGPARRRRGRQDAMIDTSVGDGRADGTAEAGGGDALGTSDAGGSGTSDAGTDASMSGPSA